MSMLSSIGQTTVTPAASDYEPLSLDCAGEAMRRPIVGWAVTVGFFWLRRRPA